MENTFSPELKKGRAKYQNLGFSEPGNNIDTLGDSEFELSQLNLTTETAEEERILQKTQSGKITSEDNFEYEDSKKSIALYTLKKAGCVSLFLYALLFILSSLFKVFTELYPTRLSLQGSKEENSSSQFTWYMIWILITSVAFYFTGYVFANSTRKIGRKIFDDAFRNLIKRPIQFFDTTPVGVIIARFSEDLNELEKVMPTYL